MQYQYAIKQLQGLCQAARRTEMHWIASSRLLLQPCKNGEVESWLEAIVAAVAGY